MAGIEIVLKAVIYKIFLWLFKNSYVEHRLFFKKYLGNRIVGALDKSFQIAEVLFGQVPIKSVGERYKKLKDNNPQFDARIKDILMRFTQGIMIYTKVGNPSQSLCMYMYYKRGFADYKEYFQLIISSFPNPFLKTKFKGEYFEALDDNNQDFWSYFILHHRKVFRGDLTDWSYDYSHNPAGTVKAKLYGLLESGDYENGYQYVEFTERENEECRIRLREMGSSNDYICLFARDNEGRPDSVRLPGEAQFRNIEIAYLKDLFDFYYEKGISIIRMGKQVTGKCRFNGCIDYPNEAYSPIMDFWLAANCRYYIGTVSGGSTFPSLFGTPFISVNSYIGFVEDSPQFLSRKRDIMIPEMWFNRDVGKIMTLRESLEWNSQNNGLWPAMAIPVKNTPQMIMDAVIEMEEKLIGTVRYDNEDEMLQERYWSIVNEYKSIIDRKVTWLNARVSRSFLKKNRWFLE